MIKREFVFDTDLDDYEYLQSDYAIGEEYDEEPEYVSAPYDLYE